MFPVSVSKIFKIAGRTSVLEISFIKVTGEISTFRKLHHVHWYLPKSSSSRNYLLTGVAGLQFPDRKATKNELLTKFLKDLLKISENVPGRAL